MFELDEFELDRADCRYFFLRGFDRPSFSVEVDSQPFVFVTIKFKGFGFVPRTLPVDTALLLALLLQLSR